MRWEEKLPGAEEAVRRWRCCGRGWWRCRNSRTAAPGGAAAVPNVRFSFLPMFRSSFSSLPSLLSVCFSFLCFFLCFSLLSVSLFFWFFLFRVSLFSGFPSFLRFPPLLSAFLASIYRGQGRCFLQLSWGAAGWSAIGRGCRGSVGGARWLVGHCVRSVGSRREWPAKIQKKATLFPFFPAA